MADYEKLKSKGVSETLLDELLQISEERKTKLKHYEELKAELNKLSFECGVKKKNGEDATELLLQIGELKVGLNTAKEDSENTTLKYEQVLSSIPNVPDDDVPYGEGEDDNVEICKVLIPSVFSFTPKEHWELAEQNNWIDFVRGVKIAQSRFSVLSDMGAKLERALINFMLDFNTKRGFAEYSVPEIVNSGALFGTGQLPKFEEDLYKIEDSELYLIPTAEVPLTNLFSDEILNVSDLPIKMTAQTACFRKEAGSGGRDMRGIIRQHQFKKVELVSIVEQDKSDAMLEEMVAVVSDMLTELGLPHRLVMLCTKDLGFSASKTIDIEVWLPSQGKYREISSVSNTRDFQAKRAKIRYKQDGKNVHVHTLNGSALAVGRTIVAIMENYQNEDGTITIPDVLIPYLKG